VLAKRGELHYGKTALIVAMVLGMHFAPLFPNLDVAFQGINTWHCIQYLALIYMLNRSAVERGEAQRPFVRKLSRAGAKGFFKYYGTAVLFTLSLILMITIAHRVFHVSWILAYYMLGKGTLLSHYYFDTFLFPRSDEIRLDAGPFTAAGSREGARRPGPAAAGSRRDGGAARPPSGCR